MAVAWGVDSTTAPAVGGAVWPSGETAARNEVRPGRVLAAAGLAVWTGCLGVGGTEGLGLANLQQPWGGLNRGRRYGGVPGWG